MISNEGRWVSVDAMIHPNTDHPDVLNAAANKHIKCMELDLALTVTHDTGRCPRM